MKSQSLEYMQALYSNNRGLEPADLEKRKNLLAKYKYSVIIEGSYLEFDNLERWIKQNISVDPLEEIYYGKTDYNYGFAEYFVKEEAHEAQLKFAVEHIYTTWGNGAIFKTNGSNMPDIPYAADDKDAIVFPYHENA